MNQRVAILILSGMILLSSGIYVYAMENVKSIAATTLGDASSSAAVVRTQAVLTVAESKRLIARGFKRLPEVQKALKGGRILVTHGTTNTYILEELLGRKIEHGAFVTGQTTPSAGFSRMKVEKYLAPLLIENGTEVKDLSLKDSLQRLEVGDLVVKGGNALDYSRGLVGTLTGSETGGTSGAILPHLKEKKLQLVIPIGLEKQITGDLKAVVQLLQQPVESLQQVPSMVLWTDAKIVTEIEALKTVANVDVIQIAAGGIGGAEGSVRLLIQGNHDEVKKALDEIAAVSGEPPFYLPEPK